MKTRILIAEDELIVANHIRQLLLAMGHEVVGVVTGGEEAVSSAIELSPDLILMDIMLSGPLEGIRAAERILERRDIPIVYVTAYADEATLERARVTEPYGYVTKPFEEGDLRAAISVALYKHRIEQRLRKSEEQYRNLFRLAPVGIFHFSADFLLTECNEPFAALFALSPSALVGRDTRELLGETLKAPLASACQGHRASCEGAVRFRGGPLESWVALHTAPVEVGKAAGGIGVIEDLTEKRRGEEELVRLAKLERILADLSADFLAATRADTQAHLRRAMEVIGIFVHADRAVLLLFAEGSQNVRESIEWHEEGRPEWREEPLDFRDFPWTWERFKEGEPLCVLNVADIPAPGANEQRLWQSLSVRSILLVPLHLHGSVLGCVGLTMEREQRTWTGENIRMLQILSQNLVNLAIRQRSEESRLDSEEKFRVLVESMHEMIFALDEKGCFTYLSPGVEDLSGYALRELIGQEFTRFIHPHDRAGVDRAWEFIRQGGVGTFECRLLTKEGEIRNLRFSSRNIDLGREALGVTGIMVDISHERSVETALKESAEQYRRLWEDSSDGLVLIDGDSGMILDCNREFCSMAGRSRTELCTKRIWEIRPKHLEESARRKFKEVLDQGTGGSTELTFLRPDGGETRIEFLSRRLLLAGRPVLQSRCRRIP
jgi:PAS domain S-box-containing protein